MVAETQPDRRRETVEPQRLDHTRTHLLVQYRGPPSAEALNELRQRGGRVLEYVPEYAFMISVAEGTTLEGLDLARAEWLRPEDKLSPALGTWAAAGPDVMVVEFHRDVAGSVAREVVRANGLATRAHPDLLPNQLLVDGTPEDAARLAVWDEVEYVFPASSELKTKQHVYACAGGLTVDGVTGQNIPTYGPGWDGPGLGSAQLGYFFGPLASTLPRASVQSEIMRAWAEWGKYAAVTFTPAGNANQAQTIAVLFATGAHGDGYPFDGPGGVLAHTFYPAPPNPESIAGDMHFDDSESWAIGRDTDVFSVALHETGHALGLGHSDDPTAVMYPYYTIKTGLTADDIAAIRTLYAAVGTAPPASPTPPSTPAAPIISITSPTSGSIYTSTAATITLAGSASCADGIRQVTWANASGGSGVASGTTAWLAGPVALKSGQNQITVTATGLTGGTASRPLTVSYTASTPTPAPVPSPKDTVAPTLTILSPPTTSVSTTASTATLSGTASDNVGVVAVTWTDSLGNTGQAHGTTQWTAGPVALRVGSNTITIRASDAAGNVGWRSVVFTRH
jgi:hypothetical protein